MDHFVEAGRAGADDADHHFHKSVVGVTVFGTKTLRKLFVSFISTR